MNIAQVEDFLVKSGKANPSLVVRIRADKAVPWDQVIRWRMSAPITASRYRSVPNRRGRDEQNPKKMLVGSMILHSVLGVTLLFGPAFLSHEPPGPPFCRWSRIQTILPMMPRTAEAAQCRRRRHNRATASTTSRSASSLPSPAREVSRHLCLWLRLWRRLWRRRLHCAASAVRGIIGNMV